MSTYSAFSNISAWNTSVAYGASGNLVDGKIVASFVPVTAISSFNVLGVTLSGNVQSGVHFGPVSANVPLPMQVLSSTPYILFNAVFNNNRLHAALETESIVALVCSDLVLSDLASASRDWIAPGVLGTSLWQGAAVTVSALGDAGAPSGVTGLTITPRNLNLILNWSNPTAFSDLVGVKVQRSTSSIPSAHNIGTTVVNALTTHHTDASLVAGTTYYYSVFAYDNVGNYSTLAAGATGNAAPSRPGYPSSPYPALSAIDPLSTIGETKWERKLRLEEEGIV